MAEQALFNKYTGSLRYVLKALLGYLAYICIYPLCLAPWLHLKRGCRLSDYKKVYIASGVLIDTSFPEKISIGKYVYITRGVKILAHTAFTPLQQKYTKTDCITSDINIEDGVYIGAGSIILPGVTLGRSSLIGAGSVVSKDIPAYAVAVGVPARVIGDIRTYFNKENKGG